MTPTKPQFIGTLVTAVVFFAAFVTMLVLYLLKPRDSTTPPPCGIVQNKHIPPPTVPVSSAGPYSLPTVQFAMQLVAEITLAYQEHRAPVAYPGTKILKVLNGIDAPDATDDPATHRLQAVGYIVQVPSKNQIWICFRGSQTKPEAQVDATIGQMEWNRQVLPGALVHSGFYKAYLEMQTDILNTLQQYANPDTTVYISGISLGSALAMLTMADLVMVQPALGLRDIRIYTFGPPQIGNAVMVDALIAQRKLTSTPLREAYYIANLSDKIPQFPPSTAVETYAQLPLTTFNADWGSVGANHTLPVHAAHIDRLLNLGCSAPK